jgi:isoquinoline 1-oxidoreductase subunit alpha
MTISLNINGQDRAIEAETDTPLLWVLRNDLALRGTKFGCGMALCGACTVHVDGQPARACVMPIVALTGKKIVTIEGADGAPFEAVKHAWLELDVVQCGYCQPGQVMAATALLIANPAPTDLDIDQAMSGNICRCGTYPRIRAAVHAASKRLRVQAT